MFGAGGAAAAAAAVAEAPAAKGLRLMFKTPEGADGLVIARCLVLGSASICVAILMRPVLVFRDPLGIIGDPPDLTTVCGRSCWLPYSTTHLRPMFNKEFKIKRMRSTSAKQEETRTIFRSQNFSLKALPCGRREPCTLVYGRTRASSRGASMGKNQLFLKMSRAFMGQDPWIFMSLSDRSVLPSSHHSWSPSVHLS